MNESNRKNIQLKQELGSQKNKEKHNSESCQHNKQLPKTETNVFPTDLFHYSLRCFYVYTVAAFVLTSLALLFLFNSSIGGQTLTCTPTSTRRQKQTALVIE